MDISIAIVIVIIYCYYFVILKLQKIKTFNKECSIASVHFLLINNITFRNKFPFFILTW